MYKKLCLKNKSDKNSESDETNELKNSIYSGDWEEGIVLFFSRAYVYQVPESKIRLHHKPNLFAREKRWVISMSVL